MGIYLPNMEMPTKCSECLFAKLSPTGEILICNYMLSIVSWDDRPFDCPLVGVPPHGRLIDADALLRDFPIRADHYDKEHGSEHFVYGVETVMDYVGGMPTIIEAEE